MSVRIRYNHYNNVFVLKSAGGVYEVTWEQIDDEYALSFVFQGDFHRRLEVRGRGGDEEEEGTPDVVIAYDAASASFKGLKDGECYELMVEEDEEAGYGHEELSSREHQGIAGGGGGGGGAGGGGAGGGGGLTGAASSASAAATAALRKMSVEDLKAQTAEYKALKEARDLEDVLFSD